MVNIGKWGGKNLLEQQQNVHIKSLLCIHLIVLIILLPQPPPPPPNGEEAGDMIPQYHYGTRFYIVSWIFEGFPCLFWSYPIMDNMNLNNGISERHIQGASICWEHGW